MFMGTGGTPKMPLHLTLGGGEGGQPGNSGLGNSGCAPWFFWCLRAPSPWRGNPGSGSRWRRPGVASCQLQFPNSPGLEAREGLASRCFYIPAARGTIRLGCSWSL